MRGLNLLSGVVAASVALLTIGGLLADSGLPETLTAFLLQFVVVTAALAALIGILNLLNIHLRRLGQGSPYSLLVILTAVLVIALRVADPQTSDDRSVSSAIFEAVQVSLESALAGLVFFFLVYAAYRLFRGRFSVNGCLFLSAALIVLLGWIPIQGLTFFGSLRDWLLEIPVTAGARGLLIGIALGTITVGLRVLIGQERAYREE